MKQNLLKFALCAMALLPLGAWATVSVPVTETYDFSTDGKSLKEVEAATLNSTSFVYSDKTLKELNDFSVMELNNRFASDATGNLKLYNNDNGLNIKGRYVAVKGLKTGDVVTISFKIAGGSVSLQNTSDVKESTTTISADGSLTFTMKTATGYLVLSNTSNNNYIQTVTITTTQDLPDPTQEEFTLDYTNDKTLSASTTSASLNTTDGDVSFYNLYPITNASQYGFVATSVSSIKGEKSDYGYRFNTDATKYLAINNLSKGDKVTITIVTNSESTAGQIQYVTPSAANSAYSYEGGAYTLLSDQTFATTAGPAGAEKEIVIYVSGEGSYLAFKLLNARTYIKTIKILSSTIASSATFTRDYMTFSNNSEVDLAIPSGVEVYGVSGSNSEGNAVALSPYNVIPANTGVILHKTGTDKSYCFVNTETASTYAETNYMVAVSEDATEIGDEDFVLVYDKSEAKVMFKKAGTAKLNKGQAYLSKGVLSSVVFSRGMGTIGIENDGTTGIEDMKVATDGVDNVYYTLQGVRVEKPTKGIYICNGKKVFVK